MKKYIGVGMDLIVELNGDASIDIRTQNFTQRDIINITRERSCVLWKGQIKNMMKNIKKILLSS